MPIGSEPGPALRWEEALARVADQPALVCLRSGDGETLLAWGMAPRPVRAWADLDALAPAGDAAADAPTAPGWHPRGPGCALQLDYEFPRTAGTAWPIDAWLAWDADGRCTLHGDDAARARRRAELGRPAPALASPVLAGQLQAGWSAADHAAKVERCRAWIAAGDIYQANLTVPWAARLRAGERREAALFAALAAASPAPYAALLRAPGRPTVVSHSPECFLRLRGAQAWSEPIKGTRRRVAGEEDAVRAALLAGAKERAELAMIVDLVRNDLGRVAVPGSVRVEEAAGVMDLPYVHHLVARIGARLAPGHRLGDLVHAAYPAGSITGAPKIRAMQIIAALETEPRGAYCGTFGWVGAGAADLAVAIRTLVVAGDVVRLQAGGGIVADSVGAAEWEEARAKAAGMARALGGAI